MMCQMCVSVYVCVWVGGWSFCEHRRVSLRGVGMSVRANAAVGGDVSARSMIIVGVTSGWLAPARCVWGVDPDVRSVRVMIYWVVGSEGGDVGGYPDIILAHDRCSVV
jgi:hypothetical protein